MAERDLLNAFEDCIERLAAGQSIDDCLHRYPQYATALRPMLEAGSLVRRANFSASEVNAARDRVRFQVAQRVRTRRRSQPVLRLIPLVASLLVIFVFMTGAATMLAESSLPGDTLYGFKLLSENVRLALVNDSSTLARQFEQRRIEEIEQLLRLNRAADITFRGEVQAVNGTEWLVEGLQVEVSAGTPGAESIQAGDVIEIHGSTTAQGTLIARTIQLNRRSQSIPTATLTSTPAPTFTATVTPAPTSTVTTTPSPTATPTRSITPVPSATACVASQPQGWVSYTVQAGDNLSTLAARTGITLEELMRVNCLTNQSLIITGQQLILPSAPASRPTEAAPQVRPTATGDNRQQDNSGRSENSGPGSSDDDDDNRGSDDDGRGSDDDGGNDNSGRGGDDD